MINQKIARKNDIYNISYKNENAATEIPRTGVERLSQISAREVHSSNFGNVSKLQKRNKSAY
jgi:hypothetical protein